MTRCISTHPETASNQIAARLRARWSGVALQVHTADRLVTVESPNLTGRTGQTGVIHAITAVLGGTWQLKTSTWSTLVFEEVGDA